jgi:Zn-dependent peptidase ImmA (M78 family)
MYTLGKTAQDLKDTYENYRTTREAAKALGVSPERIRVLCQKLGITKWTQKPRKLETAAKLKSYICEECINLFTPPQYQRGPHRFCCKKCQGKYLAKKYGFGSGYKK